VFERLFQALFSYRPVVFQQGDFRFDITTASFVAAGIAALVMGAAILTYRSVGDRGRPRDRVILTLLRMAALALVVFCLFRPTLVVKAAIPQQNVVAVLLDDSRSMLIADRDSSWGAPVATGHNAVPAQLVRQFTIASLATTGMFWLLLGTIGGYISSRSEPRRPYQIAEKAT